MKKDLNIAVSRQRQLFLLILLTSLLLSSCNLSLPRHEQVRNLGTLPSMQHTTQKQLAKKQPFKQGKWPTADWWTMYQSPQLNQLIDQALATNPSIQEIRSRVLAAKQESIIAGSALYPLLYFDTDYTKLYSSKYGIFRAFNPKFPLSSYLSLLSLTFRYEFDFWGKYHHLFFAAIGQAKALEAESAEVVLITTTALAQAYFAYQTNCMRKTRYQQLVDVRTNLAKLNDLLLNKGLSSALSPFLAYERANEAQKLLVSINEEIEVDKHLINILAGRGPDTPITSTKPLAKLPKRLTIPQTLSVDLLARRPDLMAQIWRAKALADKTGAAMADYYPDINIIGLLGLESVKWQKLFNHSSGTGLLVPALSLPLYTAGAIGANINATKAQFDAAIADYNKLLLQSTQEVLDALVFAQSMYQQKQQQVAIVNDAKKRYELTALREKMGLDNQLDKYYLQEEVIEKELTDLLLLYNQYVASVKLTKALGGGYCQRIIPLVKTKLVCTKPMKGCVPRGNKAHT